MIKIKTFVFNSFQENTFVLFDETKNCVIVDPGCSKESEFSLLDQFIEENELEIQSIVNTHCHVDHILGNAYLVNKYKVSSIAHKEDLHLIKRSKDMAAVFGLSLDEPPVPNHLVDEGDEIKFGNSVLQVKHVPGHSPGSIALYSCTDNFIIVGDVLFAGSIGRTDLPGGDYDTLISSIKEKLFTLDDNVIVYPGHGSSTSIIREKQTNPFF
ncbi:MAG: MBL fold metallo-hydrolase [Bacteroidales bacterium]|nr:MBL fold metallo-hydrolase [Bacteroidales bacterium]